VSRFNLVVTRLTLFTAPDRGTRPEPKPTWFFIENRSFFLYDN
jgi:hypothetical protein